MSSASCWDAEQQKNTGVLLVVLVFKTRNVGNWKATLKPQNSGVSLHPELPSLCITLVCKVGWCPASSAAPQLRHPAFAERAMRGASGTRSLRAGASGGTVPALPPLVPAPWSRWASSASRRSRLSHGRGRAPRAGCVWCGRRARVRGAAPARSRSRPPPAPAAPLRAPSTAPAGTACPRHWEPTAAPRRPTEPARPPPPSPPAAPAAPRIYRCGGAGARPGDGAGQGRAAKSSSGQFRTAGPPPSPPAARLGTVPPKPGGSGSCSRSLPQEDAPGTAWDPACLGTTDIVHGFFQVSGSETAK